MAGAAHPLYHSALFLSSRGTAAARRLPQKSHARMPRQLEVHLVPSLTTPQALAGSTVVMIDVLRASTTIVHALAAGARELIPVLEVADARGLAEKRPEALLAGERKGRAIEQFHLGNSPVEFTPERVAGKTIIFTTTNGTRALMFCTGAHRVLIGAFANFSALCGSLYHEPRVDLLCAGTGQAVTREDVLFAGAVVDELVRFDAEPPSVNDQALLARDAWRSTVAGISSGPLAEELRETRGGRNLIEIGYERDIEIAAAIDRFNIVPELDVSDWAIRLAAGGAEQ